MSEQIRLNKYLASCGICSRRDADKLIESGRVLVNGKTACMGQLILDTDVIKVNGKPVQGAQKKAVLAYYKPVGITCSERDPHAEKLITDRIKYPVRLTYAGRLDKESEGLMIMTNDGDLIDQMMRGANLHEKEYVVKVNKEITDDFITAMEKGVFLKDLNVTTRPCRVSKEGKYTFHIILTQGLNRQIRRMCKALGYQVVKLKRIRIMNIELGDLRPDGYRELTAWEELKLRELCAGNNQNRSKQTKMK